ncbi:MAG: hypothetical protein IPK72_23305 [Candidatus Eisenbacteria bacterium]|nr:hypothetical protein [Candidatus Eisenbacteria bacterium]
MTLVRAQAASEYRRRNPFWTVVVVASLFLSGRATPQSTFPVIDGGPPGEGASDLLVGDVPARLFIAMTLEPDSCVARDTIVVAWRVTNLSDHASHTPPIKLRLMGPDGAPVPLRWGHQVSPRRELPPGGVEEIRARAVIEPPDPEELSMSRERREASPEDRARMIIPPAGLVARDPDLLWIEWPTDNDTVAPGTYKLGVKMAGEAAAWGLDEYAEEPWIEAPLVVLP